MLHKKLKSFDKGGGKERKQNIHIHSYLEKVQTNHFFLHITSLKDCTRFMFVEKKLKQFKKSSIILNLLDSFDAK